MTTRAESAPLRSPAVLRRLAVILPVVALAACDTGDGRQLREPTAAQRVAMTTTTSSTTSVPGLPGEVLPAASVAPTVAATTLMLSAPWPDGGVIDARFTCDGEGLSPTLTWTAPPPGTAELALLVTDDDAANFVHWAVAGIPPTAGEVGEGAQITGGVEGRTDFGQPGWGGPCPPTAGETHTYRFAIYALGQQSELPDDFTGDELSALANSTGIAYAEVTGTYTRAG